jgi:inhibitor of cysteine peptidase
LLVAVLAACAPAPRHSEPGAPVTLTETENGRRVDAEVGQDIVVRLASNPTTGYRWMLAPMRNAVVAVLGEPAFERHDEARVGAPGVEVWRLRAMTKGEAPLFFEYRRSWEKGVPPARTAAFTLSVR